MSGKDLVFTILGIDRASPAFDKAGRSVERFGNRLEKFGDVGIKSLLGVQAAGIASGAAIAGAIGATPLLFGAMAAAAVSGNEDVRNSFKNLKSNVVSDVKAMAAPLADDFVGVANDIGKAWGRDVAPVMKSIFTDPAMSSGIKEVTAGITELAGNAMPGLLDAVRASPPVMEGFHSALGDVGDGVSEFFTETSRSSESAGRIIGGFGEITADVLGDTGALLGKLSDAVAPNMGRIESIFDSATNSALNLAENALPVMSSATGAALGVLDSALGVLEPISGTLGTVAGVSLAAAGGWRVLTGAGNAFTNLDLGGRLERTALSAGVMTESLTGSATAGERVATAGSKMATVLRGVGQAIPLVGVAAVGLGLAIEASNKHTEDAIKLGQDLGDALIKGGSEADWARTKLTNLTEASRTYQAELDHLKHEQANAGEGAHLFSEGISALQQKVDDNNKSVEQSSKRYQEQKDSLGSAQLAHVKYNEAVEAHGTGSDEAVAAGATWRAALDEEARKSRAAADAVKTHTERIIEQQAVKLGAINAEINHTNALLGVEQAQKSYTEAVDKYGKASFEARSALNGLEAAYANAAAAAGAKAKAENAGRSEADQMRAASEAEAAAILGMAAAAGSSAPPALMGMVRSLDATRLAALGVTGRIDETGAAIYRMPDGREIVITGENADAKRKIEEINAMTVRNKTFYVQQINTISTIRNPSDPNAYSPGVAEGGPVKAGQIYTVGERGRETFVPNVDGAILNNGETLALGSGGGGNTLNLYFNNYAPLGNQGQLEEWFTRTFDNLRRKGRV